MSAYNDLRGVRAEYVNITMRVHSHVDPACRYNRGESAARWMLWLYRCDECHKP